MLTAIVNTDLYRYEIDALIRAFYPGEEVRTVLNERTVLDERHDTNDDPAFLSVLYTEDRISMVFHTDAGAIRKEASAGDREETGIRLDRKSPETKDVLKHLLYESLKDITGHGLPWGELIGVRPTKIAMKQLMGGASAPEAARYMRERHYVSEGKADLAVQIALAETEILNSWEPEDGYSLYIGIPFCPSTCMYCSFPSYPAAGASGQIKAYLDALHEELAMIADRNRGRRLDTVYFGGGTPTALSEKELDALLGKTEELFDTGHLKEWTVEAGRPDSITEDKLKVLRDHPVTRISVNPQTMNDATLRIIGRGHTSDQTVMAFHMAREAGFDNINMDMILGLPGETQTDVAHTLTEIEKLGPDSLTVHSLAIKKGSRMQQYIAEKGYGSLLGAGSAMELAIESAKRMDMLPYYLYRQKNMTGDQENIGFAKQGKYGLYNIIMMEEIQPVAAAGAGSVSKYFEAGKKIVRDDNPKEITAYIEKIKSACR
ncbi:MAG: coproporphyrinogen dehydrogenase HemZ [Lachnospiraceae bacterium]|nr:coproporphyrinogen dehydrogenase HemZ [Lachnospiraceae bacterium]